MNTLTSIDELFFATAQASSTTVAESLSDHGLLEATRAGDEAAFAELVRRYRNQITNYIYRMLDDYEAAVDISQETFIRVYCAADRYQTNYAFSTYIYRIATNLAISELRRRKRRRLVSLTSFFHFGEKAGNVSELDPADTQPLQDIALVEEERSIAVARAIATLPEKYRAPLVLRDVEGRSYEEVARILDLSEGTVKSRISRARAFLREKLRIYL